MSLLLFKLFKFSLVCLQLSRLSAGEIVEMLFFPVVNEACRILAEGVAIRASDLDIASVLGRGFPAYRSASFVLVLCTVMFCADAYELIVLSY